MGSVWSLGVRVCAYKGECVCASKYACQFVSVCDHVCVCARVFQFLFVFVMMQKKKDIEK